MKIRKAELKDLSHLIDFTAEEAREAENCVKIPETLERGIRTALEDNSVATYWVVVDGHDVPVGSVSSVREWSDWNAGYYWWIQSMYLRPEFRGQGLMGELIKVVEAEMESQGGLELRLYVHKDNVAAAKAYQKTGFSDSPYQIMVLRKAQSQKN